MHKVLIAARVMGLSAVALSIVSCSSSPTSTTQNPDTGDNTASSPIANQIETPTLPKDRSLSTSNVASSLDRSSPAVVTISATKSADANSVPYVNPLDSIPILAQHQMPDESGSNDRSLPKKSASLQPNSPHNSDDDRGKNVRLEQLSNISSIRISAKHSNRKHQTSSTNLPTVACPSFPCLVLSQDSSNPQNSFNNPIYKLTAYRDKTASSFQLNAVTGRAFTQNRNRYQSNTEAPLPDGSYSVAAKVVAGNIPEVGGTMLPIFPKPGFNPQMRRTALGIHWDPSFDRDKKEDGTSGCVGLTNKNDYHRVRDFILKYHPRSLEVQITR
jgi:hypothetical protein